MVIGRYGTLGCFCLLVCSLLSSTSFAARLFGDEGALLAPEPSQTQSAPSSDAQKDEPKAQAAPTLNLPTPEEAYPFSPTAGYLTTLPSIDAKLTSPPVVFVARFVNQDNHITTVSENLYSLVTWQLSASSKGRLLLNLVPTNYTTYPYVREGSDAARLPQPRDVLISDARKMGARYYIDAIVDDSVAGLSITMFSEELLSGKSQEWKQAAPAGQVKELLAAALTFAAHACTVQEPTELAAILAGIPASETWQAVSHQISIPLDQIQSVAQRDPDCLWAYSLAIVKDSEVSAAVTLHNAGLKRSAGDYRLACSKFDMLREMNHSAGALLIHGQLLGQYPISLYLLRLYSFTLEAAYGEALTASELPVPYITAVQVLEQGANAYPENWCLRWSCAKMMDQLGAFARGVDTINKVPEKQQFIMSTMHRRAADAINQALILRKDCPLLWQRFIEYHFRAGDADLSFQKKALARLRELDPTNVSAELTVAYSHSVGWDGNGEKYLGLVREAAERHWNDGRALARIARSVMYDVKRLVSFKVATQEQLLTKQNEEGKFLVSVSARAFQLGGRMGVWDTDTLFKYARAQEQTTAILQLADSTGFPELLVGAACDQARNADAELALHYAESALPSCKERDSREKVLWALVRAHGRLGHYDISMRYADTAIAEFPKSVTFYEAYAVGALKSKTNLQKAYSYMESAVRLSPDSKYLSGMKDIVAKELASASPGSTAK